ncbi:tetratricopeptide repeat protein [Saccharopolyspora sp. NPDC000995]
MRQSRVAHRFGEKRCWQLAFVLRGFFFEAKLWDPWISTHRRARESAARLDDRCALAGTNSHLGVALADRGDLAGAAECYRDAPELYRELGDEPGEITVRANRGWVEHYRGEHDSALRNLSAALEHYEGDGNTRNAAIARRGIALALTALERFPEAVEAAERALAEAEESDLEADAVRALNCLGWIHFEADEHRLTTAACQCAADRAGAESAYYEQARAFTGLGNLAALADGAKRPKRCGCAPTRCTVASNRRWSPKPASAPGSAPPEVPRFGVLERCSVRARFGRAHLPAGGGREADRVLETPWRGEEKGVPDGVEHASRNWRARR